MKRFFRSFFIFLRCPGFVPAQEFSDADSRALQSFLASNTGAKLRRILRANIAAGNQSAAESKGDAFTCGMACGYAALNAWLETLSAHGDSPPQPETDPFAGADELEHLRP